jgi:hypothetical protein
MATIDQAINFTQMFQDVELSHALQKLRQDPQALQRFLQESQDKLYKEVTTQKDDTFQKVYGELERASDTERAVYYYNQRNQDLNRLQEQVYNAQKGSADAVLHDRDLAKRQYEINQWSSGNKLDTLFIYSQLFIILCTFALLLYIWQNGILSTTIVSILTLILLLIFIFTIVNRAQFTNFLRDGRFWNRRKFPTYQGIPIPNICDSSSALESAESQLSNFEQSTRSSLQQGLQSISSKITDSAQSVNQQIQKI